MTDLDIGYLIKAVNEANDNMWLGDFAWAKNTVDSSLNKAAQTGILSHQETAQGIRQRIYELRKIASKNKMRNGRAWVLAQISEEMAKKEIDPVAGIAGVLVINLLGLREMLDILVKPDFQKTLDNKEDVRKEERVVHRSEKGYRYSLERFADRWEVRAIMDRGIESLDRAKVQNISRERNAFIEDRSEGFRSKVFELYGRDIYARVFGSDRYVEVSIRVPRIEDEEQSVSRLAQRILDALA